MASAKMVNAATSGNCKPQLIDALAWNMYRITSVMLQGKDEYDIRFNLDNECCYIDSVDVKKREREKSTILEKANDKAPVQNLRNYTRSSTPKMSGNANTSSMSKCKETSRPPRTFAEAVNSRGRYREVDKYNKKNSDKATSNESKSYNKTSSSHPFLELLASPWHWKSYNKDPKLQMRNAHGAPLSWCNAEPQGRSSTIKKVEDKTQVGNKNNALTKMNNVKKQNDDINGNGNEVHNVDNSQNVNHDSTDDDKDGNNGRKDADIDNSAVKENPNDQSGVYNAIEDGDEIDDVGQHDVALENAVYSSGKWSHKDNMNQEKRNANKAEKDEQSQIDNELNNDNPTEVGEETASNSRRPRKKTTTKAYVTNVGNWKHKRLVKYVRAHGIFGLAPESVKVVENKGDFTSVVHFTDERGTPMVRFVDDSVLDLSDYERVTKLVQEGNYDPNAQQYVLDKTLFNVYMEDSSDSLACHLHFCWIAANIRKNPYEKSRDDCCMAAKCTFDVPDTGEDKITIAKENEMTRTRETTILELRNEDSVTALRGNHHNGNGSSRDSL